MASRTPLDSPLTETSIRRSFEGYQRAIAKLTIPQLLELAARQAALLQAERNRILSEGLSSYHDRAMDSPVHSMTPASPDGSARAPDGAPSRGRSHLQPRPAHDAVSAGRRVVRALTRRGQAVNAKRARAEGRR